MQIGDKIKRMRIEKGLTQEELANRCELSKGFISQLENDLTSPSIATLIDILEILGTNLKEFFSDDKDEKITYKYEDMFETENHDLKYKNNSPLKRRGPLFLTALFYFSNAFLICRLANVSGASEQGPFTQPPSQAITSTN